VRDWTGTKADWEGLTLDVLIVTADTPAKLRLGVKKHDLEGAPLFRVEPELWTAWGIANPSRPDVPVPTTWLIAPDGKVIWTTQTAVHSKRVSARRVLKRVERHRTATTP
jgi:peroxiredoxin